LHCGEVRDLYSLSTFFCVVIICLVVISPHRTTLDTGPNYWRRKERWIFI
jgi:hypothetical protein